VTVVRGLRGHRGIVGESGGGLWPGHHHGARPRGLPLPLPRWASPGGPPPQGGRPPKGGVGGGQRAPGRWWRGAPGVGGAPQAPKICVPCTKSFSTTHVARAWGMHGLPRLGRLASGGGRPSRSGWLELAGGGRASVQGDGFADARFPRVMPWMARFPRARPWTDADGSASRGSPGPSTYPPRQEP